ncbi:hypothetical protein B0H21DRAFT_719076 [Amylocystis lapponica]|nr:hypothetical protein B0H21DRAFT_719076 [Amylocystis lapponica]
MAPVLLSRALDPLLGIFTGTLAYYLYETNPRSVIPQEERLTELLRWKRVKWQSEREARFARESSGDEDADLKAVVVEVTKG